MNRIMVQQGINMFNKAIESGEITVEEIVSKLSPETIDKLHRYIKDLTPFRAAGYNKYTKFRLLIDYKNLKVGDMVTLDKDDGNTYPRFKTEDGRTATVYLPGATIKDELEVLQESKDDSI